MTEIMISVSKKKLQELLREAKLAEDIKENLVFEDVLSPNLEIMEVGGAKKESFKQRDSMH